jgi:hypothetical protein
MIDQLGDIGDLSTTIENDRSIYFNLADQILKKSMKNRSLLLTLEGNFQVAYAKDARGGDFNGDFPDGNPENFNKRMDKAKELLEQAWALDAQNSNAAAERILIAQGLGEPRDVMERWFSRAIAADPDNIAAYQNKMGYLAAQGDQGKKEAIEFGGECLRTQRWNTPIPGLLLDQYTSLNPEGLTAEELQKPEVWAIVKRIYQGYIAVHQRSNAWRTRYAISAARGGYWADADYQLKQLGSDFSLIHITQSDYDALKKEVADHMVKAH